MVKQNNTTHRIAVVTLALLLVPFTARQITGEVNWDLFDFLIMGILISGTMFLYRVISKRVEKKHRLLVGVVLLSGFLYIWAELAVGIFTNLGS